MSLLAVLRAQRVEFVGVVQNTFSSSLGLTNCPREWMRVAVGIGLCALVTGVAGFSSFSSVLRQHALARAGVCPAGITSLTMIASKPLDPMALMQDKAMQVNKSARVCMHFCGRGNMCLSDWL